MSQSEYNETELLKAVLAPLLEDFQYWFLRSRNLLENERIDFFTPEEQAELLERVKEREKEVMTAQMLFKATEGQVGIDTTILVPWHKLVAECWQVSMLWRSSKDQFKTRL